MKQLINERKWEKDRGIMVPCIIHHSAWHPTHRIPLLGAKSHRSLVSFCLYKRNSDIVLETQGQLAS